MRVALFASIVLIFMSSCSSDPLDVTLTNEMPQMEVLRMDEDLFSATWEDPEGNVDSWRAKYHSEFDSYAYFILNNPPQLPDSLLALQLKAFSQDEIMRSFFDESQLLFGGGKFENHHQQLQKAFQYYSHHFPGKRTPDLFLFQGGFNYKVVPNDSIIGMGLEWYLGTDHPLIKKLSPQAFPQFEKAKMKEEFFVVDAVKGFLKVNYQDRMEADNLLSTIIFYGKIQYLTEALLRDTPEHTRLNYSEEEFKWLEDNEKAIWTYMAENEYLFNNDMRLITQWINDGPFTTGLPQESPSRAGIYMGWKLVKAFMEKNEEMKLRELMEFRNYNAILSAYKPK